MRKIRSAIRDIPFIMLAGCAVSFALYRTDFAKDFEWLRADLFSSSLATSVFMLFYARMHRYCAYSFIAIYTLIALAVLNTVYFFVDFPYYWVYGAILIYTGLALTIVFYVTKRWRGRHRTVS